MDRFKLMETYEAVVKCGSLTSAAKSLGVTTAMVSKRIQDLEAALGVKLLNRNTHRFNLTDSGTEFYEKSTALLAEVRRLEESMLSKRRLVRGEINILCTRSFSETLLAPIFTAFSQQHNSITLKITSMDRMLAPRPTDIIDGGYDFAIRSLTTKDSSLIARPLLEIPQVIVASPSYLDAKGSPASPQDLALHNCFDPAQTSESFVWEIQQMNGPHSSRKPTLIRVSGNVRTNSASIIRHAALNGLGIALLRRDLVGQSLRDGTLREVLPNYCLPRKKFYVVYQRDVRQPQRIRLFIDFLIKNLRQAYMA